MARMSRQLAVLVLGAFLLAGCGTHEGSGDGGSNGDQSMDDGYGGGY